MSNNYSYQQLQKIVSIKEKSELFGLLTILDIKDDKIVLASWRDIFGALSYFTSFPQGEDLDLPEKLTIENIKNLQDTYGFDIDHIDKDGNNLLLYAQAVVALPYTATIPRTYRKECFVKDLGQSNIYQFDACVDYILENTKDVYLINNDGEQLPFRLISHGSAGSKATKLIKVLANYPDFNLDIVNKHGYNVLTNSVYVFCPPEVLEFLSKLQIDKLQINKKRRVSLTFH